MMGEQWVREHIGTTPAVEETTTAAVPSRERVAEILAGKSSDSRAGDLRDLGAYIAQLEAQRGGVVVVPDITDDDISSISVLMQENGIGCHDEDNEDFRRIVAATWAYAQGASPIPASQVLQPGMVGVDREEMELLRNLYTVATLFSVDADPAQRRAAANLMQVVASLHQYSALRSQAGGEG